MVVREEIRKTGTTRSLTASVGRAVPAVVVSMFLATLGACQQPTRPLFAQEGEALVWPPEPLPTKIRHVGELSGVADLQARKPVLKSLHDLLVGEDPPESLYGPRAVLSLADMGLVWVADPGGRCLHLFDLRLREYAKITHAGPTRLLTPVGLSRGPEGTIYVCDSELAAIFRLSERTGEFIAELALPEVLQRAVAVHYDAPTGDLFVVDSIAHNIKVISSDGSMRRIIGRRGIAPGEFNFPLAVTADAEMIWVVDTGNQRIQGLSRDGEPLVIIGREGDAPGNLTLPKGIALDSRGHIYVVDGRFENVQIFDRLGRLLLFFGEEGTGPGEFWLPTGIDVDADDRIWICDSYNRRLQVFDYVGLDTEKLNAAPPRQRPSESASVSE